MVTINVIKTIANRRTSGDIRYLELDKRSIVGQCFYREVREGAATNGLGALAD